MDPREAKAAYIKAVRREILTALNVMYHIGPLPFPSICGALTHMELPDDECVKRDLNYLCEKGYVRWTNKEKLQPWRQRQYKLTAAGTEIADAISSDPSLQP